MKIEITDTQIKLLILLINDELNKTNNQELVDLMLAINTSIDFDTCVCGNEKDIDHKVCYDCFKKSFFK